MRTYSSSLKNVLTQALWRSKMASYVETDPVKALDMQLESGLIDKKEYNEILTYL
ncbi:hypothetical protein DES38_103248 [Streptohalobacillus salinus]|uniref:Uncharacterized protein n=1 Tax=Streptohalobacillus salinus TaxID=621096 RepID=A0A2V3WCD3_9BACI|nr:hypothetical protein [Streptohalobacillus salinus]PXW92229.1 hypothetical protein DES38_103248 [Streptohalobacillus salinus]